MLLRFTQDATTITLSGDGAVIAGCSYVPGTPKIADVSDMVGNQSVTVVESAEVVLTGTAAQIVAQVRAIEVLLSVAPMGQRWASDKRVYINYRAETSGNVYRSEVVAGRVEWPDKALTPLLASDMAAILVIWERRYWWEDALSAIGLKRTGVTKTTSGVTVYNHHDSTTHENFVDIEGADIGGSLPAPLKLSLEATAAIGTRRFYMSGNIFHTPASFTAIYEGENSTAGGGALESVEADANSSNGNFMRVTWTTSIAHTRNAWVWSIAAAQLGYGAGAWVRVLARLANTPPANCYARLKIYFDGTTPLTKLWEGPEILLDSARKLQDLGSVQLPPGYAAGSPTALALVLSLRHTGTSQADLDFIQLIGPDGVHRFEQQGYQLEIGDFVVDDGPNEAVYIQTVGGFTQHIFADYPPALAVWPGRDMRLRLLFDEGSGMVISRTTKVYAQYRPRRLTV